MDKNKLTFDKDVIAVTGAAGGIGKLLVLELARRGARVVVNDLGGGPTGGGANAQLARAVVDQIQAEGGEAIVSTENVATQEGGARITQAALDTWGRIDGIVANAAIVRNDHFEKMSIQDWDDLLAVNLRGVFCTVQPAYRAMIRQRSGRIVITGSSAGSCGGFGQSNYSTAKAGLMGLSRSIAWEGAQYGIKANLMLPAARDSRMASTLSATDPIFVGRTGVLTQFNLDGAHGAFVFADRVAPMAVVLLHRSCPVSGEILGAMAGWYFRTWPVYSEGWATKQLPTAEDLAAHWETICGRSAPGTEIDVESMVFTNVLANKLSSGS